MQYSAITTVNILLTQVGARRETERAAAQDTLSRRNPLTSSDGARPVG